MPSRGNKITDSKQVVRLISPEVLEAALKLQRLKEGVSLLQQKPTASNPAGGPIEQAKTIFESLLEPFTTGEYKPLEVAFVFSSSPDQPSVAITRTASAGAARIDRELLLEQGVSVAKINAATVKTPYEFWTIKEQPPEEPA